MGRPTKIAIVFSAVIVLLLVAAQIIYHLQPLRAFNDRFERVTGVKMPEDYVVLNRGGNIFSKSIRCSLQFNQTSYKNMLSAIRKAELYNDSATCQRITLGPRPSIRDTIQGVWMENDSSVYFVNNFLGFVRSPVFLITRASIDKRSRVFDGVMLPLGTEFLRDLQKTRQSGAKKVKPNSARGQRKNRR